MVDQFPGAVDPAVEDELLFFRSPSPPGYIFACQVYDCVKITIAISSQGLGQPEACMVICTVSPETLYGMTIFEKIFNKSITDKA